MSFKIVEIEIEGTMPLLQHRATEEALAGNTRSNNPTERNDPRDECERCVYRIEGEQIAVPGTAFARLIREAGGSHKARGSRKSLKYLVPSCVIVLDDLCLLFLHNGKPITTFEVDSRPVTIPATKGRVMRHRARFNEWRCKFHVRIDEEVLSEATVRQLFNEGLQRLGIGDFRPEKGGPFGTAAIIKWKIISEPKPELSKLQAAE